MPAVPQDIGFGTCNSCALPLNEAEKIDPAFKRIDDSDVVVSGVHKARGNTRASSRAADQLEPALYHDVLRPKVLVDRERRSAVRSISTLLFKRCTLGGF